MGSCAHPVRPVFLLMNLADQCLAEGLEDLFSHAGDTAYVSMAAGTKRRLVVLFQEPTGIIGLEPVELTAPTATARTSDVADVAAGDTLRIELPGADRTFEIIAVEPDSRGATKLTLANT